MVTKKTVYVFLVVLVVIIIISIIILYTKTEKKDKFVTWGDQMDLFGAADRKQLNCCPTFEVPTFVDPNNSNDATHSGEFYSKFDLKYNS